MINYTWDDEVSELVRELNEKRIKKEQIIACFKQSGLIYVMYEEEEFE